MFIVFYDGLKKLLEKNIEELKKNISENEIYKFKIKAIPSSKLDLIDFEEEFIKVKIKEKAIEGKANKAIIKFLSSELDIPKSKIKILNGEKGSIKTIQVTK